MKKINFGIIFIFTIITFLACNRNKPSTTTNASTSKSQQVSNGKNEKKSTSTINNEKTESPFQFTGEEKGCGSFTLYKLNIDKKVGLEIVGNREKLKLSTTEQRFQIGKTSDLKVKIIEFDGPATQFFCDDVVDDDPNIVKTWKGISGSILIQINEDKINVTSFESTYKMTLKLETVTMKDETNQQIELKNILFENVYVGWFPG